MKQTKLLTLFLACSLVDSAYAVDGHGAGSGGGVVICIDGNGKITSEAHDLYEGRIKHGLSFNTVRNMAYKKLGRYLDKQTNFGGIRKSDFRDIQNEVFRFLFAATDTFDENKKELTEDLEKEFQDGKIQLGKGCTIQNLYRYYDKVESVETNGELAQGFENYLNELKILEKHEQLYLVARRELKDTNSARTRNLLAYAASDQVQADENAKNALKAIWKEWLR